MPELPQEDIPPPFDADTVAVTAAMQLDLGDARKLMSFRTDVRAHPIPRARHTHARIGLCNDNACNQWLFMLLTPYTPLSVTHSGIDDGVLAG